MRVLAGASVGSTVLFYSLIVALIGCRRERPAPEPDLWDDFHNTDPVARLTQLAASEASDQRTLQLAAALNAAANAYTNRGWVPTNLEQIIGEYTQRSLDAWEGT